MNFLAPLFLLGALAVAGPVIFHLIRRTTREVTPFSSLMFLQPTPPRVTRRSRLENIWLLLLRCLVLLALALGFSRPFFRAADMNPAATDASSRRLAILVDTSASMQREDLWQRAREKAAALLRSATPSDSVALLTFDRVPRLLADPGQWAKTPLDERVPGALRQLESMTPGWSGTDPGAAVLQALDVISGASQSPSASSEVVIITDMQEGARLDALHGIEWPANVTVRFDPVVAAKPGNASPQWLTGAGEKEPAGSDGSMRVRVMNAPESKQEQFHLAWGATPGAGVDVYVPAGESRVATMPKPPPGIERLLLTGDESDFDNGLWLLPPQPRRVPVLFLGADADGDTRSSLFYLRRAFEPTPREIFELSARRAGDPVAAFEVQNAHLVFVGDGATDAQLASARQFAKDGRLVVFALPDAASAGVLGGLLELPGLDAEEAKVRDYSLLAQIDFQSAPFTPFDDPRFSDFTKIHFWRHRRIDAAKLAGARVLATFEDGDPAMLRVPLGKGAVIVLASTWRPADSQLALSSKFVPMLHALLDESAGMPPARPQYFVGDEIPLPPGARPFTMRRPDGATSEVAAGGRFADTALPGIYVAEPGSLRFVVNMDPEECRTSPLAPDRLAALSLPSSPATSAAAVSAGERTASRETEQRQKLWRWLVIAAVIFLLAETLSAAKLSTHPSKTEVTS